MLKMIYEQKSIKQTSSQCRLRIPGARNACINGMEGLKSSI